MNHVGVWDVETCGVQHWGVDRDEFFRIGGLSVNGGPTLIDTERSEYSEQLGHCDVLIGHNTSLFDGPAIWGRHAGEIMLRAARARGWIDTFWLAAILDPPPHKYVDYLGHERTIAGEPARMLPFYKLENLAHRYGFPGKVNDLKALAEKHGGFDQIPVDNQEYRDYLRGDVEASRHLAATLVPKMTDYAWREMRVAALAGAMHCNGFRLDQDLTRAVIEAHTTRNNATLSRLAERYGVPLTDAKGRPRAKPLAGKEGKAALEAAFRELLGAWGPGTTSPGQPVFDDVWPMTPKGAWAWGGEKIIEAVQRHAPDNLAAAELARDVAEIGGTRTVFKTALDTVRPDGFCHSNVHMLQRTGRASVTDPGLTVFGKHNGRHLERGIFVPDVLEHEAEYWDQHVIFTVDLAQMDARAVAALSQDQGYLELFAPGRDSHTEGAIMVWGPKSGWAGHDYRQHFKKLGHGNNYGMGPDKLAREAGVDISVAHYFQDTMRQRFPRLEAWKHEVRAFARQYGWVDNGFGRHVLIDADRAYTQAPAGAGQGATRDVLLQGALDLDDVAPEVLKYLKAMVHDEFVWSVPRRDAVEIRQLVVKTMSGEWCPPGASRPVPVIADASHFADRWSGCYEKVTIAA
jgi:DNA polymerase I